MKGENRKEKEGGIRSSIRKKLYMRSAVIDDYIIWLRWVGQRTLRDNAVCKLYLHFESSFFSAIIGWILREIEKGNIGSNSNEYKKKKKRSNPLS